MRSICNSINAFMCKLKQFICSCFTTYQIHINTGTCILDCLFITYPVILGTCSLIRIYRLNQLKFSNGISSCHPPKSLSCIFSYAITCIMYHHLRCNMYPEQQIIHSVQINSCKHIDIVSICVHWTIWLETMHCTMLIYQYIV